MGAAPVLRILKNGEEVKACPITGEAVLGRAESCVIRLDDRAISRQHAVIRPLGAEQGAGIQIERKSEFAPITVNGAECTSAILKNGDVIEIGPYLMKLSMEAAPAASAAPAAAAQQGAGAQPAAAIAEATTPALAFDPAAAPSDGGLNAGGLGDINSGQAPGEGELALDIGAEPAVQVDGQNEARMVGDEAEEPVSEDGATRIIPVADIAAYLALPPGSADVEQLDISKDEIVLGRRKGCDIVLADKKASGRHTMVRRSGVRYFVKDLGSSNGTYLNGTRIVEERELSGDDWIRIGQTEIQFKANSKSYAAKEKDFPMVVDDFAAQPASEAAGVSPLEGLDAGAAAFAPAEAAQPGAQPDANAAANSIAGIGPSVAANGSLLEKFRALPPKRRIMMIIVVAAFLYLIMDEDEPEQPAKKAAISQKKEKGPVTFAQLSPEQRKFVESQHALAFDYYKNREYDKALFELNKIFALVQDYKDSREIERYAKEGKRKLEAIEEEKRRKEDEAKIKAKIEALVSETSGHMARKEYDKARELFAQILTIDPDNKDVEGWRKQLADFEEQRRLEEQRKEVMAEVNKRGWEIYREGMALVKKGRCRPAIVKFKEVGKLNPSSEKLTDAAEDQIASCELNVAKRRNPVIEKAKDAEATGEFKKAYLYYKEAILIDPDHPAGYAGVNRVKGVLHDRAKAIYTEGVLAESFSDFFTAKKRFQECLDASAEDDIYHDRAKRRLARYFKYDTGKEGEAPQQ